MLAHEQQQENGGLPDNCMGKDDDDENYDDDDDEDSDNHEMHPALTRSLPASARGGGGGGGRGGVRGGGGGRRGGGVNATFSNHHKIAFKNSADATSRSEVEGDVSVSPSLASAAISNVSPASSAKTTFNSAPTTSAAAAAATAASLLRNLDEDSMEDAGPQGKDLRKRLASVREVREESFKVGTRKKQLTGSQDLE